MFQSPNPDFLSLTAAYLSLETVFIEEGGEVGYQSVPDDRELEVVYLAPELQQHGVVTEKVIIFWSKFFKL